MSRVTVARQVSPAPEPLGSRPVALVDLLDRLLAKGVVVAGEVTLTIADVDLVHVSLRALITSVRERE
jgi:gas vesicle protein GvpA/GvpJ/GvpM family